MASLKSNKYQPRLCHLRKWPDCNGYGFNLKPEKSSARVFVGQVDRDSPAESAGLISGDRVVEVNSRPVTGEPYSRTIELIKQGVTRDGVKYPDETILLVVDPETDEYYKTKSKAIKVSDPNILKLETKPRNQTNENQKNSLDQYKHDSISTENIPDAYNELHSSTQHDDEEDNAYQNSIFDHEIEESDLPTVKKLVRKNSTRSDSVHDYSQSTPFKLDEGTVPYTPKMPLPSQSSTARNTLNLPNSAAEYRAGLEAEAARKREALKINNTPIKERFSFVDNL